MNASRAFAIVASALFATTTYAFEATEFIDPPSTLSRAEVQAAVVKEGPVAIEQNKEATVFVDATAPVRTAQDVRTEAKLAARHYGMAECPYVGG